MKILIAQYKTLLTNKKKIRNFKEPILLLIRRNGKVEYYQKQANTEFTFEHSDGKDRTIHLEPSQLLSFEYGSETFKGYIAYEDEYLPYPQKPILYSQTVQTIIDKIMNDINTWKAQEFSAKGKMWWSILGGIALCIVAYAVYTMLKQQPAQTIQIITANITPPVG